MLIPHNTLLNIFMKNILFNIINKMDQHLVQILLAIALVVYLVYNNNNHENFRMFNSNTTLKDSDVQDLYTPSDAERLGYQYNPITRDHNYYQWFNPTRTANNYPTHMETGDHNPQFYHHNGVYYPRYWQRSFHQSM